MCVKSDKCLRETIAEVRNRCPQKGCPGHLLMKNRCPQKGYPEHPLMKNRCSQKGYPEHLLMKNSFPQKGYLGYSHMYSDLTGIFALILAVMSQ